MSDAEDKRVLDREGALARLGGNIDLFDEIVTIYLEESPAMLAEVSQAVADRDVPRLVRSAHALKGALLNLSADSATEMARQLEHRARNGVAEGCEPLLSGLERELSRLEQALSQG